MTLINRGFKFHNERHLKREPDMNASANEIALPDTHHAKPLQGKPKVIPRSYRLVGNGLNFAARINRRWAARRMTSLWFRVNKRSPKAWVKTFWASAETIETIEVAGHPLAVHLWGSGPLVVMLHGWNGSGTQFRQFIPRLVAAGYQVALFDAPAHGGNPGTSTHVGEFADSLLAIQRQIGPVHALIAHSLGSMGGMLALQRGLAIERLVLLAPHLDANTLFERYADILGLSDRLLGTFHSQLEVRMNEFLQVEDSWSLLSAARLSSGVPPVGVLVYDELDEEVPLEHFAEIERHWRPDSVLKSSGLGHFKLLKHDKTIERIVSILREN